MCTEWLGSGLQIRAMQVRLLSPTPNFGLKVFMDAHEPVTLEEGDRYPLGPPSFVSVDVEKSGVGIH